MSKFITIKGVSGKVKRFDEKLNKYDIEAREVTKKIFGNYVENNPDKYGEDMLLICDDLLPYKFLELQVCAEWTQFDFPYDFPFVYSRKMRFDPYTIFLMYNKDYTRAIIFSKDSIDKKSVRLIKYSREKVNFVSWGKVMLLNTNKLDINSIKAYTGLGEQSDSDSDSDSN